MFKWTESNFVSESKSKFPNKFNYEKLNWINVKTNVTLYCCEHNVEFKQNPKSHIKGFAGCPKCKHIILLESCKTRNYIESSKKTKIAKLERYGDENYNGREKAKITCLELYGVDNPSKLPETRIKAINTSIERHGIKWWDNSETCLLRYGVSNASSDPGVKLKRRDTFLNKYGVESNFHDINFQHEMSARSQNPKSQIKREETSLKNYGVRHYSQSTLANERNYQQKDYILPSGKIIKLMGYEPRAIDILFKLGYSEHELLLTNRPTIKYLWPLLLGGDDREHVYHPDIIIPVENKIIEVKSSYTINDPRLPSKIKGAEAAGWNIEVWIL